MLFKTVQAQPDFVSLEKRLLDWWQMSRIIPKYLNKNNNSAKRFFFLDGPITANNPMGVHHAWGRTLKDLYQRYHNMKGEKQRFQNGFDCQGLWVEVEVEKELGFKNKKDIEKYGIDKFVQKCKERVKKFSAIQTEQSKRLAYFMDWENSYYTMSDENNYMIWYFLKKCWENDWIYKGTDSVPWCPRCETAISQHEMLTEDYKEITHETVFFKLPVLNKDFSLVAWTTTPWTIPANVALAINPNFNYRVWQNVQTQEKIIILREDSLPKRENYQEYLEDQKFLMNVLKGSNWKGVKDFKGCELIGLKYQGPFDSLERIKKARSENPKTFHTVVTAEDLVVATKGTGILHVAPGAGKEDFDLGKKESLPVISVIADDASYLSGMGGLSGKNAKKHPEIIIDYLKEFANGKYLLKTLPFTHRYPACWRCKTELVWKVAEEWYIAMDAKPKSNPAPGAGQKSKIKDKTLRERMVDVAGKIKWLPEFGLERELDWLKNMHDWLISKKNRYWGLALPIWECSCGRFIVIGSQEELRKKAVKGWKEFKGHTPHRPWIDKVKIKCECGKLMNRVLDVGNPWLDAGIVPFSTLIDPATGKLSYTTDKKYWTEWYPADFITESFPGQFKNWFYSLIAMASVLEYREPYKIVLGFGTLLGEDGRPMHKSWGNAIEFEQGADKIGVDVMRWMFSLANPERNLLFGYRLADETRRKFHLLLWNIYKFFTSFANLSSWQPTKRKQNDTKNLLDKWILARISQLIIFTTNSLDKYDHVSAALAIQEFVNDLSLWYIRRCRERVNPQNNDIEDRYICLATLYSVFGILCRLLAPFNPFITEEIYTNLTLGKKKNLTPEESVHLTEWPEPINKKLNKSDLQLLKQMDIIRQICELGHAARKKENIRVRQPLKKLQISNCKFQIAKELLALIKDELNVKQVDLTQGKGKLRVNLDTQITPELKAEGEARDLIRKIQMERKKRGCKPDELIDVILADWPAEFGEEIKRKTLSRKIIKGNELKIVCGKK